MTSIYLVRRGNEWLHVWGNDYKLLPFVQGAAVCASHNHAEAAASLFSGAEPVEFREERGHEQSYNHALDCVDRVFQIGGQPEPPLLPDFCQLGEDKFLAVIRLAEEFVKQRQALVAAQSEVEKLSRRLKAAEK